MNEPLATNEPIDKAEWERRFAARIMAVANWPEWPAMQTSEAAAMELDDMQEEFRKDPEAAADEEMSCWGDDGDE